MLISWYWVEAAPHLSLSFATSFSKSLTSLKRKAVFPLMLMMTGLLESFVLSTAKTWRVKTIYKRITFSLVAVAPSDTMFSLLLWLKFWSMEWFIKKQTLDTHCTTNTNDLSASYFTSQGKGLINMYPLNDNRNVRFQCYNAEILFLTYTKVINPILSYCIYQM